MKPNRSVPWWASLGLGEKPAPHEPDLADLGTAFGLDQSFANAMTPAGSPAGPPAEPESDD